MRIDVITIFPEYLDPLRHALLGKAIEDGYLSVRVHNLRGWATDRHGSVDGPPAGGGPGMVMKPQVWGAALDDVADGRVGRTLESAVPHLRRPRHDDLAGIDSTPGCGSVPEPPVSRPAACGSNGPEGPDSGSSAPPGEDAADLPLLLVPTPAGAPFTQADARAWSRERHIVFACGRYEGIDQRVFIDAAKRYRVREVSIGDYVLIGGEAAVLVITEAVARLIPGVLGNARSHEEDSFSDGLLEGPCYTKPREWRGLRIPDVLLSGDHGKVARWRHDEAVRRTRAVRPDLLPDPSVPIRRDSHLPAQDSSDRL